METAKVLLITSIEFSHWNQFCLLKYSILNLSFISCSFSLSFSNIPRYLYPSSISFIFSPLGNYARSTNLTFPLFIIITPHFLILNSMPMSWRKIFTVDNNSFNSHSLFSYRFKSSTNRGCLILSPPHKVYLVLAVHSTS